MKPRLLLIGENKKNIYLMTFLLEGIGYEIIQATDWKDGILLAEHLGPEAIILDIQRHEHNPTAVAGEFKRSPLLSGVPIILATSPGVIEDEEEVRLSGVTGFVQKPINTMTFVSQLQFLLSAPHTRN